MTNASPSLQYPIASLSPAAGRTDQGTVAALGRFIHPRPPLWPAIVSAGVHVVIGIALLWSAGRGLNRHVTAAELARFMPPPPAAGSSSGSRTAGLAMADLSYLRYAAGGLVAGAANRPQRRTADAGRSKAARSSADASEPTATDAGDVYTVFQVDNAAQISEGSAVPQYPPDLLARRVRGKVIVRFVVDSSGVADVQSIQILDSSAPQFEESVRAALPRMRFSPARLNGKRVRQLVEQPFRFDVVPPTPKDSAA